MPARTNQDRRILSPSLQRSIRPPSATARWRWRFCRPWSGCLRGWSPPGAIWIYRALTFLVISCPCALVISIPLSFFAGIGGASNAGVLVKGSNYLEALSQTKCVVFDKTGTLTQGVFEVNGVHHSPLDDAKLLEYAALAEMRLLAPHQQEPCRRPTASAIDRSRVTDIQEISGQRRHAPRSTGTPWLAGNGKLMRAAGHPLHRLPQRWDDHPHRHRRGLRRAYRDLGRCQAPCQAGHCGPASRRAWRRRSCSPAMPRPWQSRWPRSWAWTRSTASCCRQIRSTQVEELLREKAPKAKLAFAGRRHQRCAGADPGGYRHRHGRHGRGCCHRGGGRRPDG